MKNKLIVTRHQAKLLKSGKANIACNMRRKNGKTMEQLATDKFLNQVFWVAEPLCSIKNGDEVYAKHFSCDDVPHGWRRTTLDRAGSRVTYGEHRHLVKCTDVRHLANGAGDMFTVAVTLVVL